MGHVNIMSLLRLLTSGLEWILVRGVTFLSNIISQHASSKRRQSTCHSTKHHMSKEC